MVLGKRSCRAEDRSFARTDKKSPGVSSGCPELEKLVGSFYVELR
jgi:hypothetical protein